MFDVLFFREGTFDAILIGVHAWAYLMFLAYVSLIVVVYNMADVQRCRKQTWKDAEKFRFMALRSRVWIWAFAALNLFAALWLTHFGMHGVVACAIAILIATFSKILLNIYIGILEIFISMAVNVIFYLVHIFKLVLRGTAVLFVDYKNDCIGFIKYLKE